MPSGRRQARDLSRAKLPDSPSTSSQLTVRSSLAFNQFDYREVLGRLAPQHREAFALLREGLRQGNLEAIGAAATLSARAHQAILVNPLLEPTLSLAREVRALGVCRAHSGTLLGLLLDPEDADVLAITTLVARRFAPAVTVFNQSLVSGGLRLLTGTPSCPSG